MNNQQDKSAKIHALSHDGRGIATIENKTTFIAGALPQETVSYRITNKRGSFNEAIALEILEKSADRATPPCQHFGLCGGCSLQHMSIDTQTQLKQQTLLDQLTHFGKVKPVSILPPLYSDSTGYRRKARLGVKFVIKKNKLLIGFREKKSRYLAELESCQVLHPRIGMHFDDLRALIMSLSAYQTIPQIELAMGDTDTALVFRHMEPLSESDRSKLVEFGKNQNIHIYLQPNPPEQVNKAWPENTLDRISYSLPADDLTFLFHPLDFTQINLEMNRQMVQQAIDLLDLNENESVLDLYCGIGNFTLPMAKRAHAVTGIEGSEEMVKRAYENAAHNQIKNVEFFAANLEKPDLDAPWLKKSYDKVLLDPPRVGAEAMLPYIAQTGAKRIVYVSCNPATLARDAGILVHKYGYHLQKAGIMNMFPHTAHVEAMAVFEM